MIPFPQNLVFLDVETTGLRWWAGDRPFLVGLANCEGETALVDLRGSSDWAWMMTILEDPLLTKVGHNIGFDVHMLRSAGFIVNGPFHDTELMARYCFPAEQSYKLKSLARSVLELEPRNEKALKDWLKKERARRKKEGGYRDPNYSDVPREIIEDYLRDDLTYTATLAGVCAKRITGNVCRLLSLEWSVLEARIRMESRGVFSDTDYFRKEYDHAQHTIRECESEMYRIAGREFKWKSTKQLGEVFTGLGCTPEATTATGKPCFNRASLETLDHPLAREIERARSLHKIAETYYKGLVDQSAESVIHPSFRQHGAKTGRFSCKSPNLQNIPRRDQSVRRGFVCRPGYVQVYLDFEQIEWKIFAHYTRDPELVNPILAGTDGHVHTAKLLFGQEVTKKHPLRQVCKTLNFALIYGAGTRQLQTKIQELLKHEDSTLLQDAQLKKLARIGLGQTKELLGKYHCAYPGVRTWMKQLESSVIQFGRVTDVFGKDYWVDPDEAYKAANYIVQGSAAMVMKRGLVRLQRTIDFLARDIHITNVVHDEVQLEIPGAAWDQDCKELVSQFLTAFEDRTHFEIPITADVSWSDTNWAEKRAIEENSVKKAG